jgi:hypothetical protein
MATDYNLVGFNPEDPTQLLIDAGRSIGVPSITETPQDEFMMHQALVQASYQAHVGVQGHQNFSSRAALTMQKFPGAQVSEICAESWPGQSAAEAAGDAYTCWKQSPGHWKECNRKHSVYGYAMAYCESNKTWYSCAQFADFEGARPETPDPVVPDVDNIGGLLRRVLSLFRGGK